MLICNRFYFLKLLIILWSLVRVQVGPPIHQTPFRNVGGFVLGEDLDLEASVFLPL